MQNAGLDESQAGIKIARRDINNLTYADDTTLMAENEEELKSLLMRVKEKSGKTDLKLNIQKLIMGSSPITAWQIEGGKLETVTNVIFLGSKIIVDSDYSHEIKIHLLFGRKVMTNLESYGFPGSSDSKEFTCSAGDPGLEDQEDTLEK